LKPNPESPKPPYEESGATITPVKLRSILEERQSRGGRQPRVHVIINPAAGQDQPVLKVLNATFQNAGMDWDVFVTKKAGDGRRLAQEAVEAGADIVAAQGGDGTVMEVASGLMGSGVPLAILPGGTANVMSLELGIPAGLVEACALLIEPEAAVRPIDMGTVSFPEDSEAGEHNFILRASVGFEAAMVEGADREMKDRLGVFAYAFSALQALADPAIARYRLTLDGQEIESEGLACIVANSGTMGISGMPALSLAPNISVSDGLLDVVVVTRADLPSIVSLVANAFAGSRTPQSLQHWQAREILVRTDPAQPVQVDGEIFSETPYVARAIPQAVNVITPPVVET
jgi:YegS/Rv2252/BmrU family lipid kinase